MFIYYLLLVYIFIVRLNKANLLFIFNLFIKIREIND